MQLGTPDLLEVADDHVSLLQGPAPRVVIGLLVAGARAEEHERLDAIRVRCREERSQRPAGGVPDEHRTLALDRVEHHADLVHPLLQREQLAIHQWVGEPDAQLVEHDQPAVGRKAAQEAWEHLPLSLHVAGPVRHVEDVDRSLPHRPMGDATAGRLRVADTSRAVHRRIIGRCRSPSHPRLLGSSGWRWRRP